MESTNNKKNIIIINNKYNNIIVENEIVTIIKTKKYKNKHVQYVEIMSVRSYIKMMENPSDKKTYMKRPQRIIIKKNKYNEGNTISDIIKVTNKEESIKGEDNKQSK